MKSLDQHPCFNADAKHAYGRVHLPVAPKCNIQCNYCNRKYDCVNESRPGVTSTVLTPQQSLTYLRLITSKLGNLAVVGIAGPGDAFANGTDTLETLRLIKEQYPDMMLCLSTNGLELFDYIPELTKLDVSHVTITINDLDAKRLAAVYSWVRYKGKVYRGEEGAGLLIREQLRCIPELKKHGILVKINTIVIPGVNDNHIEELAKTLAQLGIDTMNCIPMKPVADTPFADIVEPSATEMKRVYELVGKYTRPMTHCSRCRADAVGLLGQDFRERHCLLKEAATSEARTTDDRTRIAVSTSQGLLVDIHLGVAPELWVYEQSADGIRFIEKRSCPPADCGDEHWRKLAEIFSDCRAILTAGAGNKPMDSIAKRGIKVHQMPSGSVLDGLRAIFGNADLSKIMLSGSGCKGNCKPAADCA